MQISLFHPAVSDSYLNFLTTSTIGFFVLGLVALVTTVLLVMKYMNEKNEQGSNRQNFKNVQQILKSGKTVSLKFIQANKSFVIYEGLIEVDYQTFKIHLCRYTETVFKIQSNTIPQVITLNLESVYALDKVSISEVSCYE